MKQPFDALTKHQGRSLTRRQALKTLSLGIATAAMARFGLREAQAISNGVPDENGHPNVGGIAWRVSPLPEVPPPVICGSGTLVHPRVYLTAGHATYVAERLTAQGRLTLEDILVSFAPDASDSDTWLPVSGVLTHPGYLDNVDGSGNIPIEDVGVLILRDPVTDIAPFPLPHPGFLDELAAAGQLQPQSSPAKFTVVGYGVEPSKNYGHMPLPPDGVRRVAESEFMVLHERWLFVDMNIARDQGGTCSCDSGGPTFWVDPDTGEETLVAIVSRGSNALDNRYRLDTPEALTFVNRVIEMVNNGQL